MKDDLLSFAINEFLENQISNNFETYFYKGFQVCSRRFERWRWANARVRRFGREIEGLQYRPEGVDAHPKFSEYQGQKRTIFTEVFFYLYSWKFTRQLFGKFTMFDSENFEKFILHL